jgi:hypothetical protein
VAIQKVPIEVNVFVKGLITEASPLTFPENASIDERNFVLNRDGTRNRRLGMDSLGAITNVPTELEEGKVFSAFEWENAGGVANKLLIVVQYGKDLMVFNLSEGTPVLVTSFDLKTETNSDKLEMEKGSFASVDGLLVGVFGEHSILKFEYVTNSNTINVTKTFLKIRDQFGIEVAYERAERTRVLEGGETKFYPFRSISDMLDDDAVQVRPFRDNSPNLHFYNLRNQSWGRPRESVRLPTKAEGVLDPIEEFDTSTGFIPSNADAVPVGLINYAEEVGAPVRFVAKELGLTPLASSASARGFFVIDALRRGISRKEQYTNMFAEAAGDLTFDLTSPLRADATPDGARAIAEFAGRLWYAGFSGDTITPDTRSPRMSSYVLFSQLVTASSNVDKCYQANDPTYEQEADLLATDGGLIRLDEAYGIKELVSVSSSLLVFASNGVWAIRGGTDVGFTADAYIVEKITDQGAINADSIVEDGSTLFYWSTSGLFAVAPNEIGTYSAQSLTKNTIQKFYEAIPIAAKENASGVYDRYENKLRWTYSEGLVASTSKELVLDLNLQAFYPNTFSTLAGETPTLLSPVVVRPFSEQENNLPIFAGVEEVLVGVEEVILTELIKLDSEIETMYVSLWSASPLQIAFCLYKDTEFKDWTSEDALGADAEAYFITGYGPQGDFQRRKQVPSITSYMTKTEDGFTFVDGDLIPVNTSSCIMQARWDWHNSPSGNRWGRENQIYKNKRVYMPEDVSDDYDTGEEVITTKTKVRGNGKTISLLFKTEPEKDCKILGWSMITDVSTNV